MFQALLILFGIVGVALAAAAVLETGQHLAQIPPVMSPQRPLLLVYTFPTYVDDITGQLEAIKTLEHEWHDRVDVTIVGAFDQLEDAARYGVMTVPTTILLNACGQVAFINEKVKSAEELRVQAASVSRALSAQTGTSRAYPVYHEEQPCQS